MQIRRLSHVNLNPVVGACVEPQHVSIVTEYCSKGSLQDVLENENIKLDRIFTISFATDIAEVSDSIKGWTGSIPAMQSPKTVSVYFTSKWKQPLGFAEQYCLLCKVLNVLATTYLKTTDRLHWTEIRLSSRMSAVCCVLSSNTPANTCHSHNIFSMVVPRIRRWPAIEAALVDCLGGLSHCNAGNTFSPVARKSTTQITRYTNIIVNIFFFSLFKYATI